MDEGRVVEPKISRMEKKEEILECSKKLFLNYGVRSVTMDDIAHACCISKKTIYNFFESKSQILSHLVSDEGLQLKLSLEQFAKERSNALLSLQQLSHYFLDFFEQLPNGLVTELRKFYPDVYLELLQLKINHIHPFLAFNINHGKRQNLYRSSVDADILVKAFDTFLKILDNDNGQVDWQAIHLLNNLVCHGLVTEKGLQYL